MSSTPLFSIIVPVYRVEAFLAECVESILSQTFSDFELLLVDDGSPDGCPAMCDAYARRDPRVRVVHTQNGGVSRARNIGLDRACGQYVMFVDSDDTILPQTLAVCQHTVTTHRLDLLQFSHSRATVPDCLREAAARVLAPADYLGLLHPVCVGGGVYRRTLIEEAHLRFQTDLRLGEDQLFVYGFIYRARRVMFIPNAMYVYRENLASATHCPQASDTLASIRQFAAARAQFPLSADRINAMLLSFLFTRSLVRETPLRVLSGLYASLHMPSCEADSGSVRLFHRIARVHPFLGFVYARMYYIYRSITH